MPDEDRRVLKPCPFCGGGGELGFDRDMEWSVCCADCVACSDFFPSKAGAIAAWNRRAADLLDRLEGERVGRGWIRKTETNGECRSWLVDEVGWIEAPEHLQVVIRRTHQTPEEGEGDG